MLKTEPVIPALKITTVGLGDWWGRAPSLGGGPTPPTG
jgi:hypothetical protein